METPSWWITVVQTRLRIITYISCVMCHVPSDRYLMMMIALTDQLGRHLGRRRRHPGLPFHENTEGLEAFTSRVTMGGHESKSSVDEKQKKKTEKEQPHPVIRRPLYDRANLTDYYFIILWNWNIAYRIFFVEFKCNSVTSFELVNLLFLFNFRSLEEINFYDSIKELSMVFLENSNLNKRHCYLNNITRVSSAPFIIR